MSRPLTRVGLTAARLAARPAPRAPAAAARAFSTSPARRMAAPSHGNKDNEIDYSQGASALDKAAQLFFFTEIVRGE